MRKGRDIEVCPFDIEPQHLPRRRLDDVRRHQPSSQIHSEMISFQVATHAGNDAGSYVLALCGAYCTVPSSNERDSRQTS